MQPERTGACSFLIIHMRYPVITISLIIMSVTSFAQPFSVSGKSDTLHIRGTGSTDKVMFQMRGGLKQPLEKDSASQLFSADIYIRGLQKACFSYQLVEYNKGENLLTKEIPFTRLWVGSQFKKAPEASVLKGSLVTDSISSSFLQETKGLCFYLPPGYSPEKKYPVIFMLDGQKLPDYVKAVDYLVSTRKIVPIVIAGIYSSEKVQDGLPVRYFEYVRSKGSEPQRQVFDNHVSFFIKEALPYAAKKYHLDTTAAGRVLYGTSNAGNFCVYIAAHFSALFQHIIAYSCAGNETGIPKSDRTPSVHLGAGTYEGFPMMLYDMNRALLDSCKTTGVQATWEDFCGGHDNAIWKEYFLARIESIFKTSKK